MKKTILILIFIVLDSSLMAQIDTTSLSYYPLNDGDYWEYEVITTDHSIFPFGYYVNYYSYEVIGDTLFPNNNNYKIIIFKKLRSTQTPSYIYEKVDSSCCNVYRYNSFHNFDILIDSLKSNAGDSCKATRTFPFDDHSTICLSIRPDNILSTGTISKTFEERHWHSPIEYKLSKGFGLTYMHYYYDFGTFTQSLLYAKIDSMEYGTQVNYLTQENNQNVKEFHLYQNYPNPFNPKTNIQFYIPRKELITLKIYNLQGKKILTLVSDILKPGMHTFTWDASNISSGIYMIQLQSKNQIQMKKCLLIK